MSKLETLFENFIVDGEQIPVARVKYTGTATKYVTYTEIDNFAGLYADDEDVDSVAVYDFDIYCKGSSFKAILKAIKQLLKSGGWQWQGDSPDMYEEDTGYFHKTTTFAKEYEIGD